MIPIPWPWTIFPRQSFIRFIASFNGMELRIFPRQYLHLSQNPKQDWIEFPLLYPTPKDYNYSRISSNTYLFEFFTIL